VNKLTTKNVNNRTTLQKVSLE